MGARPLLFGPQKIPMLAEGSSPLDPENPYAMINLVPDEVRHAIEQLPPRFYKYSEADLRRVAKPNAELCRLRINFWDEYLRAIDGQRKMYIDHIIKGVCGKRYFYEVVLHEPSWIGYLAIPPVDYQLALRELLELGWTRLREVLEMPLTYKMTVKSKEIDVPNTKLIAEFRHIVHMLDQRVKGAILQKMQVTQKNLNMNVEVPTGSSFQPDITMTQLDAMEKQIERMKTSMDQVELLDATKEEEATTIELPHAVSGSEDGSNFAEESDSCARKDYQGQKTRDS